LPASAKSLVTTRGPVVLVSQDAFILNTSVRENILFGRAFEHNIYERVLEACCLNADLEQFGVSKDLTEIGERGVTLSGGKILWCTFWILSFLSLTSVFFVPIVGQKQRVALARAAYAQLFTDQDDALFGKATSGLVILDDPLSALDAGTAKLVFERLLKGPAALFSNAAVVLVTHASHFLSHVDNIVVLVEGKNEFTGPWASLVSFRSTNEKVNSFIEFICSAAQEKASDDNDHKTFESGDRSSRTKGVPTDKLMTVEDREYGLASASTWLLWFKHAGGFYFMSFQLLFMTIDRLAYVAVEYWLARWTNGAETSITAFGIEFDPQTDGRSAQYSYLKVFSSLLLVSVVGTILRSRWSVTGVHELLGASSLLCWCASWQLQCRTLSLPRKDAY
jgi:hypothetical protein